jgi:two-component system LytT family sensor kinase
MTLTKLTPCFTSLSQLLRLTLEAPSDQLVPLERELHFLDQYLEIMHTRFEHRLQFRFEICARNAPCAHPTSPPATAIENAISHGVAPQPESGVIIISASIAELQLRLSVCDTGRGLAGDELREGVGITNARARLQEFYGNVTRLVFRNHDGLKLKITLPLRREA